MKFYYADGTVFDGEWQDAPGWGVQVITWGRDGLRHQGDYYRIENGEPVAMDYDSMIQYVVDSGLVKVGYMLSSEEWKRIYNMAKEDLQSNGPTIS